MKRNHHIAIGVSPRRVIMIISDERRWRGIVGVLLTLCCAVTGPARADEAQWAGAREREASGAPVVAPGERQDFAVFDLATGTPLVPGGIEFCLTYPSNLQPIANYDGALNVALVGSTLVDGASCTSFGYSDFSVAAAPGGVATPVAAYVSGNFDATGVLVLVGLGRVEVSFWVDLLDITEPNAPRVVASRTISSAALDSASVLSVNMGLSADAGSATLLQIGVEPEVGIPLGVQIKRVKLIEGVNFDAQLQRGHTYRLQANASGRVVAGPGGGIGAAVFVDEGQVLDFLNIPNILSRDYWLQRLFEPAGPRGGFGLDPNLPKVNLQMVANELPVLQLPEARLNWPGAFNDIGNFLETVCDVITAGNCGDIDIPDHTQLWPSLTIIDPATLIQSLVADNDNDGARTTSDVLHKLGLPTRIDTLLNQLLSGADLVFGSLEQWVNGARGGARFVQFAVTIMPDQVELLSEHQASVDDQFDALSNQLADARSAILGQVTESGNALADVVQQNFAALNQKFDGFIDESTRIRIQQSLSTELPVVEFMLPAAHGGKLEITAQIVNEALDAMVAAGEDVGAAAFEIQTAELHWSLGNYKQAYGFYVRAYRAITAFPG